MRKKDHIRRVFKNLWCFSEPAALESASIISGAASESCLNEPTNMIDARSVTENRSHDTPTRDLWKLALEKLPLEDKNKVSSSLKPAISKLDILRLLNDTVLAKQNECDEKSWKIELNGRQINLRDVVGKIAATISRVQKFGDVAVSFDPGYASLPWAAIKLLLEMAVAENQQRGALLIGVEKMTHLISRCEIYETLYLKQEHSEQEVWRSARSGLESALVALYATMLTFFASAIRAYDQSVIHRTFCAVFNPAELPDIHGKFQELEITLATEVDNCERIHNRQVQTSSDERLKQNLVDLEEPVLRIDTRVASMFEKLEESERLSILQWISSISYEEIHNFVRHGRTLETGTWLLRHERYCEWRASNASMILWLYGDPGAGKTKLISTVIDNLSREINETPNHEALAYFYCDRNQSDRQDPTLILSSFVRQLSASRKSVLISRSTVEIYHQKKQKAFASGKLTSEESMTVLTDLFKIYRQVTLVVDALDECDTKLRLSFLNTLERLITESSRPVKILISSRRDVDIKHRFEKGPNLEISAIENRSDIELFVDHQITQSDKSWKDGISFELKEQIRKTLVEKSEGMFQWVALQIAALRELYRESDIRDRLGKLPETLKLAYDEIYQKIMSQKGSKPIIANRAFQWIMCSCWPLSQAELVAAVCQDPDTSQIDEIDVDINLVLSACQNLLVVDQKLNICRFSHLSVQEYFETHHWNSCEPDCFVGKICLSTLICSPTALKEAAEKDTANRASAFSRYVCVNWTTHVQRLQENDIIDNHLTLLLRTFLESTSQSSLAYQTWQKCAETICKKLSHSRFYNRITDRLWLEQRLSPGSQASLAIVGFGFYNLLRDWWKDGFTDINQKNSAGDSLLVLGALRNSLPIVQDLLEKGADINASNGEHGNALQAASLYGHESMVQLLLKKKADVNASGGIHYTALQTASYRGHESIVQLLLNNGADVNLSGGENGSALQAASYRGHESVVQLLLSNEADVNLLGGEYGSALQAASCRPSLTIVRLLLGNGADVNAPQGLWGSALQVVSMALYPGIETESVVQLLLEKGADVNASSGLYNTALQAASFRGSITIVQLLLDNGAEINLSGGEYGSALQAASFSGSATTVQLLLENGADVNASGGRSESGSALSIAADCRHQGVVQLLLNNGADANLSGGDYGSALQAASYSGSSTIVRLLLENGADVNASGGRFGSALQAASCQDSTAIVQLLLSNGADVNASGGRFGSALQAASHYGSTAIVQLLLNKGADINFSAGDLDFGSALQAASRRGSIAIVQLLLSDGADVNFSGGEFGRALQAASYYGSTEIMQLLLSKGADVNFSGGEFGSALQAASRCGTAIVQLLLSIGADVNLSGGEFGSALQAASHRGHESMVQMLLDKGAEINLSGGEYGSALQAAVESGSTAIVQLLLSNGADVNLSGGNYGSALQTASYKGHESIVQMLLDKRAEINLSGGEYGSALQAASYSGSTTIVQLLLSKGADVNLSGGKYGSALQAASYSGSTTIVQLLLSKGADVSLSGGKYGSALQAASYSGSSTIVRLLLENGGDVNASGGEFGSALQAASSYGSTAIVQLLLSNGADVNASGGIYGSALQAASAAQYRKWVRGTENGSVMQLLLEKGADVNASSGRYYTALQAASYKGNESIVQMLLDKGAEINLSGGDYGSALQAASHTGSTAIVKLLLSKEADVNLSGGKYGSALKAASCSSYAGSLMILQLLLSNGADVNASGGEYGSALSIAALCGLQDVVQLLLSNGADVNLSGGKYGSALQAASYSSHSSSTTIVQLLLSNGADVNASGGEYGSALSIAADRGHQAVVRLLEAATKPQ